MALSDVLWYPNVGKTAVPLKGTGPAVGYTRDADRYVILMKYIALDGRDLNSVIDKLLRSTSDVKIQSKSMIQMQGRISLTTGRTVEKTGSPERSAFSS